MIRRFLDPLRILFSVLSTALAGLISHTLRLEERISALLNLALQEWVIFSIISSMGGIAVYLLWPKIKAVFQPLWKKQVLPAPLPTHTILDARTKGKISARNAQIPSDLPFTFARAETGGRINMDGIKVIYSSDNDGITVKKD